MILFQELAVPISSSSLYAMLITSTVTVGLITFILRAVIQFRSYGGLFLIGLLITPRIASITTHGIINRAVGKSNFTWASVK